MLVELAFARDVFEKRHVVVVVSFAAKTATRTVVIEILPSLPPSPPPPSLLYH